MALFHCLDGGKNSAIVFFFFGQGVQINRREIICRHHREHLPSAQTPPAAPGKGVVTVHRSAHRSAATRRSSILSRDDGALGGRGRFFQDRGTPWRPTAWPSKREELHLPKQEIPGLVRLLRLHYLCIKHNGTCRNFIANLETNKQTTKKTTPPVSSLQTFQLFSDARRRQRSMWRMWRVRRGRAGNTSRG